jgi:hypothetical protein
MFYQNATRVAKQGNRIKTTSILEKVFHVDDKKLKFNEVAGQKDKRARWAPYFEALSIRPWLKIKLRTGFKTRSTASMI